MHMEVEKVISSVVDIVVVVYTNIAKHMVTYIKGHFVKLPVLSYRF